ncbi:glycine betaine ABC transporter substrate-binding protein [Novacetimonas cocois]|uniref:Glycine/betaine ABC transporter n=1 Tax=Novacetimonas cocois TaxID=1747507 RepID=A0A365YZR3_9PROT|nr:glycine betaine ABC transporter substrate-binding protein [Novacetimonas cocois]RBM09135.1 glycine/betaine ABC transporter [Novacetimonas cocois]
MTSVTLGHLDETLHEATAAAVARVLEAYELEIEYVPGTRDALMGHMRNGDIDLFVSAWLPDVDGAYLDSSLGMEPLGDLYRPEFGWYLPTSAATGLTSIAELASEVHDVNREIVAAQSTLDRVRQGVVAYNLTEHGFTIAARPDEEAMEYAIQAVGTGDPAILALWQPNFLHYGSTNLTSLADPKGALGPAQTARMLVRSAVRPDLDSDMLDELDELTLGNKVVSALDHAMRMDGMSADAAAEAWQRGKLLPR